MTKKKELAAFEKAVRKNDKAAMFEYLVNEIIEAGIPAPGDLQNPFFVLFDADGQRWGKLPYQMSAADILEYVDNRFGPLFVGFIKDRAEFTTH
jgi:hypothetical protein